MNRDITFCSNRKCKIKKCIRNPRNVKESGICYSIAKLEGTELCRKRKKNGKQNNQRNREYVR